ncbi:MAG TPA: hypothetical protein VNC61_09545 [Acidimicrobiales bacterium]|nr:hypothetical protein [Acidimicrobiales bacterium]
MTTEVFCTGLQWKAILPTAVRRPFGANWLDNSTAPGGEKGAAPVADLAAAAR